MQASLPYRVPNSAWGLACTAFSGPTGVEGELALSGDGKPQLLSGRRADSSVAYASRVRSSRDPSSSRFRTAVSSTSVDQAQREVDSFLSDDNVNRSLVPRVSSKGRMFEESNWYQEGSCAFQEGSPVRLGHDEADHTSQQDILEARDSTNHLEGSSAGGSELALLGQTEADSSHRHLAAARRLKLIDAHLQSDVATCRNAAAIQENQATYHLRQRNLPLLLALWDTQAIEDQHPPVYQPKSMALRRPGALQDGNSGEPWRNQLFHCPYIDCHHNLDRLNTKANTGDLDRRPCIHIGCAFTSDTATSWLGHVTGPHHDLQGIIGPENDMDSPPRH